MQITLPNNWKPRDYQMKLWSYLERGGKRAMYTFHRRAGKDDVALHHSACAAMQRVATYWYMLPQASQSRKAIWDAVNPHSGKRRIDEAFPLEIRSRTRNNEMFIELVNGSTWQVVGSDNFNSLVGSPPVGCVFSEWALSNPFAWSYLRPILAENGGWAIFNFTPRGRNHAVTMFEGAVDDPAWFTQKLTAYETNVFSAGVLEQERIEYIRELGEDDGDSRFRQEYLCDFSANLVGSYYAKAISELESAKRIGTVDWDRLVPVCTAWDLGYSDDTAIWFYQTVGREIRIIDFYQNSGQDIPHYLKMLQDKPYVYDKHYLPWDAVPKTLASGGKSVMEQVASGVGIKHVSIAPNLGDQDQVQATRAILPRCWFDAVKCRQGIEALKNFQRVWDDDRKMFSDKYLHNWASHPAKAFHYMAVSYIDERPDAVKIHIFRAPTLNEAWSQQGYSDEARI